jgi:hypothetical protein
VNDDDPRHGTISGYKYRGCRCDDCRAASVRYEKGRRWLVHCGLIPTVPATGFRRRVHALMAIGWTQKEIAAELGIAQGNLAVKLRANESVRRATHVAMCEVYDRLCMTRRDSTVGRRTAGIAARRGWPPPLAWDDIDSDPEPSAWKYAPRKIQLGEDFDPVVVMRLLEGDRVPSTAAERAEALAQWVADGGSESELCRWHGWRPGRYGSLRLVGEGVA